MGRFFTLWLYISRVGDLTSYFFSWLGVWGFTGMGHLDRPNYLGEIAPASHARLREPSGRPALDVHICGYVHQFTGL